MTAALTSREERATARHVLTPKQFDAWDLTHTHRMTLRQAAIHLGISHVSVRDRLAAADRALQKYSRSEFPKRPRLELVEPPSTDAQLAVTLLIQRDGPKCYLCQQIPAVYCVEHIIPRARGGTDTAENLALACVPCNAEKGADYVSLRTTSGRPVYHRANG